MKRELATSAAIALAAVVARWRAVRVGLMSDDFMQQAMLDGLYPDASGRAYAPFDLYAFLRRGETMVAHVEQGTAPWWSVPELHGTVLRPLASLLLWADRTLLPGEVELWHVHSMVWLVAAILAFGLAAHRLLPRSIATIAVLLFACEAGLASPLAWLANRCVLTCAAFGFLAIWAHAHWRAPGHDTPGPLRGARSGAAIVGALMAASVLAGEYALGILAYLAAWEIVCGQGPAAARARALIPAVVPIAGYLVAHKLLGYGTFGAEVYADPFHTPLGYLDWASKRLPKLIAAGFWSIPGATIHVFRFSWSQQLEGVFLPPDPSDEVYRRAHVELAVCGVVLAALVLGLARRGWSPEERSSLRALGVGGFLGLLPIAVAPAHSRLLVVAQLGACCLVAAVIVGCARLVLGRGPAVEGPSRAARLRGVALIPLAGLLAWVHTIGDLRWGDAYLRHLDTNQAENAAAFTRGDLLDRDIAGRDVVILNGPSQSVGLFGEFVLHSQGRPTPRSWRPLALGSDFAMLATRPAPDTLELAAIQGAWLVRAGELFFRREDQALRAGDVLAYPTLRAEVIADDDGHPTQVRFRFDRSLDDPSLVFVVATRTGLRRWPVPAVGGRNVVPLPRLPPVVDPDAEKDP